MRKIILPISFIILIAISLFPQNLSRAANSLTCGDAYITKNGTLWTIGTPNIEKILTFNNNSGTYNLTSFKNKTSKSAREYIQDGDESDEIKFSWDSVVFSGNTPGWTYLSGNATQITEGGEPVLQLEIILSRTGVQVSKHYIVYPGMSLIREWVEIKNTDFIAHTLTDPYILTGRVMTTDIANTNHNLYWMEGTGAIHLGDTLINSSYTKYCQSSASSAFLPWFSLFNPKTKDGLYIGFDYYGIWRAEIGNNNGEPVNLSVKVADYNKIVSPGEIITMPKGFSGVYNKDLDEMGNSLLEWQYRYRWDYTREPYFGAIRMAPKWGIHWNDFIDRLEDTYKLVKLMSYCGADCLHQDYGWWDKIGTWNGPDWSQLKSYLNKHNIAMLIYMTAYRAAEGSEVATEHPEWLLNVGSDDGWGRYFLKYATDQNTYNWILNLLDKKVKQWGDFAWRNDGLMLYGIPTNTELLNMDEKINELIKQFLDTHQQSAFQSCNYGGTYINWENNRLSINNSSSDGSFGTYNFYLSYLFPPDKLSEVPETLKSEEYNDGYRSCLTMCFDCILENLDLNVGMPLDKKEGMRVLIDIYKYMKDQGVAGKGVRVYHPNATGDDPYYYFERLNKDTDKGMIIFRHRPFIGADDQDKLITYTGSHWSHVIRPGCYKNTISISNTVGEYFNYSFNGTSVKWIGGRGMNGGRANVYIDGAFQKTVDTFNLNVPGAVPQQILFSKTGLSNTAHTIKVEIIEKNQLSSGSDIEVDAVETDHKENIVITIYPKGLNPSSNYNISYQEQAGSQDRIGSDIMTNGITMENPALGELIYLNMPYHPGNKIDKTPPTTPTGVSKNTANNLGHNGIEIIWSPSTDDHWLSYYEIYMNGIIIDKVAKGTYYFDDGNTDINANYQVKAVDGAGNKSSLSENASFMPVR